MDAKDKRIAELESEVATLKAEKKKKKKRDKTKFALENLDLFKPTLETIKKQDRYIFTRGKQQVIKINEFIRDLLVAKIKLESPLPDAQIGSRLSMDEASLIKFLSDGRAKKVGAGRKPNTKTEPKKEDDPVLNGVYGVIKAHLASASSSQEPKAPPPPAMKEKRVSDPNLLAQYKARGFPYEDLYSKEADEWFNQHPEMPIPD